jgi:hypothetical protein
MVNPRRLVRPSFFALLLSALSAASVPMAYGQFTLTTTGFSQVAVDPGGSAIATIDLGGTSGVVSLSCAVTLASSGQSVQNPQCSVSPDSATPPAEPSLTVTTAATNTVAAAPPGLYSVAVTGVSGSTTVTLTLALTIVDVNEDYTLSVLPTTATPSPVSAGNSATTQVTVSPIGTYSGQVTLACLSVNPVVAAAPYCSFQYLNGNNYVDIINGVPASATMTITTLGPTPTTTLRTPRIFYALWLAVPGLALVGAGGARSRRKRLVGLLLLTAVASGLLLMPACGSTNNTNNPTGLTTPSNTYTFTLTAADAKGIGPSNTTTSAATVTLQVN